MSRVGKNPVAVPDGVSVEVTAGMVRARGSLGELAMPITDDVEVSAGTGSITVAPRGEGKRARAMWGTTRANIDNMVRGVSEGFTINLEITGVGYRAAVENTDLVLALGFSHPIRYPIPDGIRMSCSRPTAIAVQGIDKQKVGQVAAEIRGYRPPEPFKGKGIRYEGEMVRRKEGKKK